MSGLLIISRISWSSDFDDVALDQMVALALAETDPDLPRALLLPIADDVAEVPTRVALFARLAVIAGRQGVTLAGAAPMRDADGTQRLTGFLIAPHDRQVAVEKVLPETVRGYAARPTALTAPFVPGVLDTPLGRLGLLIGEDVLAPHLVRATAFAGAEILLNPASERDDRWSEGRALLRAARAYENVNFVATAAADSAMIDGVRRAVPGIASLASHDGSVLNAAGAVLTASVDLQALRRRRRSPWANFPPMVRTALYARDYHAPPPNRPVPESRADWRAEGRQRAAERLPEPHKDSLDTYGVMLIQTAVRRIADPGHRDAVIAANLSASLALAGPAMAPGVKLVVFPEYWLQGVIPATTLDGWLDIAIEIPGRETAALSAFAQKAGVYVAGAAFERDPDWPGRWFNCAFIIAPNGDLIHKYRKIQCGDLVGILGTNTPGGMLSAYLDRYGYDHLFPVARTPIGNLATPICFDVNFPETTRAMVRRGAEIILHPTAEPHHDVRRGWDLGRRARALENRVYWLSACIGGEYRRHDDAKPEQFHRGYSHLIDFDGVVQAVADTAGETPLGGHVDLAALRAARRDAAASPFLWDEPATYLDAYLRCEGYPCDIWLDQPITTGADGVRHTLATVARYERTGVYAAPL